MKSTEPKILFLDIETSNLNADLSPILCVGYKFLGESTVKCPAIWDYKSYHKNPFSDKQLCKDLAAVISEADVVVTHYGNKFDLPFINARFLINNIPTIDVNIKKIDTYIIAKYNTKFTSKRLKNLASVLNLKEQKMESGGWTLWLQVLNKNRNAMNKMVTYCKQDIRTLEALFLKLRPLIKSMPKASRPQNGELAACNNCNGTNLCKNGIRMRTTGLRQRFLCQDCGSCHDIPISRRK